MYEKLEVDPITGEVTKDELELPTRRRLTFATWQRQDNDSLVKISMRLLSLQWRTLLR
jgi:hypothetical protein